MFQITFANKVGRFDIDVTTFQMAVLFAWNQRPNEKVTYENLRLATELPDPELRRTLWSLCAFPKLKRQLLLVEPHAATPKDFANDTRFWVNQEFSIVFVSIFYINKKSCNNVILIIFYFSLYYKIYFVDCIQYLSMWNNVDLSQSVI